MSEYKYYLRKIDNSSSNLLILELKPKDNQPIFSFRPGQYVLIAYRDKRGKMTDKHAFSIASSPTKRDSLLFGIRVQGDFTKGLELLKIGDELSVAGPYGDFCYDERKHSSVVMIAGGIGITPFFSALNYASDLGINNHLALLYSARKIEDAAFYNEIKDLAVKNKNITTLFSFTEEAVVFEKEGIINQRFDAGIIKNFVGRVDDKIFFICGPKPFMDAMVVNLNVLGVGAKQIKMEEFVMIPRKSVLIPWRNFAYAVGVAAVLFVTAFSLINRTTAVSSGSKNIDTSLLVQVNQGAIERLVSIYEAKNKALVDLNQQIIAAGLNGGTSAPVSSSNPASESSSVKPKTVPAPATLVNPTPVQASQPISIPRPRTRVS